MFKVLIDEICKATKCDSAETALVSVTKNSRIKVKVSGEYELTSAPKKLVDSWKRKMHFPQIPGLKTNSDLENGKYEGGFKVWEGTYDLIDFINNDQDVIGNLIDRNNKLRILELGAGAALASLALIQRISCCDQFDSDYRIHIQDYNWQVLASLTLTNLVINLPHEYLREVIDLDYFRFFHGDWKNFKRRTKYNLILMSEVIYNADNFGSLHNLIETHTKKSGYVVIATKNVYFGLTGGLYEWLKFMEDLGVFRTRTILNLSTSGIPRSILVLQKKGADNNH